MNAVNLNLRTDNRHHAQMLSEQTAHRINIFIVEFTTENLAQLINTQTGRETERAVIVQRVLGALVIVLIRNVADQLLNQILKRDQTGGAAVLINNNRHVRGLTLHLTQQVHGALRLGLKTCRAHQLNHGRQGGTFGSLAVQDEGAHRVLQVEHAQNLIARITNHRHTRITRTQEQAQRLTQRGVTAGGEHVGTRNHERTDAGIVHLKDGLHHLRLVVLDGFSVGGAVQELAQLLLIEHAHRGLSRTFRRQAHTELIEQTGRRAQQNRQVVHRASQHTNRRDWAVTTQSTRQHMQNRVAHQRNNHEGQHDGERVHLDQVQQAGHGGENRGGCRNEAGQAQRVRVRLGVTVEGALQDAGAEGIRVCLHRFLSLVVRQVGERGFGDCRDHGQAERENGEEGCE